MSLQEKVEFVIQPHNMSFNVSRVWFRKFFNWHKLALCARTSFSQKLSKQMEGVLRRFYEDVARIMRNGKYPLSLAGNMHKTPAFFDRVPAKCISKEGERESVVHFHRSERKN